MIEHGVQRLIFSSTAAIFGDPIRIPIDEAHPRQPVNPYGWSKSMVEQILADCDCAHGLRSVALRYFNAAGAHPDGLLGERHDPETHLIPLVLQAASGRRTHHRVFGTDYDTPDGTCIRDYIHVQDLVEAHLLALDWLLQGKASTAFNLGNGHGFSIREVIHAVENRHRPACDRARFTSPRRRPRHPGGRQHPRPRCAGLATAIHRFARHRAACVDVGEQTIQTPPCSLWMGLKLKINSSLRLLHKG